MQYEAKSITAFITPDRTGQFTRIDFVLTNTSFKFTRAIDKAIESLKNCVEFNYIGNYFIPVKDWTNIRKHLQIVLATFEEVYLTLRPIKYVFTVLLRLNYKLKIFVLE